MLLTVDSWFPVVFGLVFCGLGWVWFAVVCVSVGLLIVLWVGVGIDFGVVFCGFDFKLLFEF